MQSDTAISVMGHDMSSRLKILKSAALTALGF